MKYICDVMIANTSIKALVQLIDDPDDNIYEHVRVQLKRFGNEAIPYLENSWGNSYYGMLFQSRVEKIIHEIKFEEIKSQVQAWADSSDKDLLEGALIVARYQYPELDEEYNIKIIMGNNILTSDNIILDDIKLKLSDKKIFINIKLDMYIFIKIETKINTIYTNVVKYYNNEIPYYNKLIDIDNYKLKFDLLQTIKIINKKINNNLILLDEESIEYLRSKFKIVINTINTITNQKLLDIKNNLKKQFFID